MARFARDRRLVEAIADGVDAMLRAEGPSFDSRDLIRWLGDNRPTELGDLLGLYGDWDAPAAVAGQQLGKFLETLGQVRVGEQAPAPGGGRPGDRNGSGAVSVWEVSERARRGLAAARAELFEPGGFFDRIAAEPPPAWSPGWLTRGIGAFRDDPVFDEMVRLGREFREADGPADDEP